MGVYATDFRIITSNQLQSIKSTTTILNDKQDIMAIDIQATVGNLTVLYGDKPQIDIGSKIVNHAFFTYDNGTPIYRDDFEENNLTFDDSNT